VTALSRLSDRRGSLVYGVPVAIFVACGVMGLIAYQSSGILRTLMLATMLAAPTMYWRPGRYATAMLLTAAWLGRAVSALWGIDGFDDRANWVVVGLWPALWYLAMIAIFALHRERDIEKVLGV
jgi:hypothetical protein